MDLNSRHVHMFVYQMCQINNVELSFVLPNIALSEIEHRVLRRYQELALHCLIQLNYCLVEQWFLL